MAPARIGLMGFGRIGRNVFRLLHDRDDLDIVAVSDIADPSALTYLLKYDSIYGRFPVEVDYEDGHLNYGTKTVSFDDSRTPADTKWSDYDVDIVLDTTSRYRSESSLQGHLDNGASNVVLTSSPETPGEIPLLLRGINDVLMYIEYVDDPIVSSDVRLNSHSGIYDSLATLVTGDNLVKTITWFNNGWGYSHRVVEAAAAIAAKGGSE